jgi:CRP/FNR family cyclic AMP-dependent transcriptional regulator
MSEIKDFLKHFEMFIGLSEEKLDKVAVFCRPRTFAPDSIIIERNSPADCFYLIEDGTVEIIATPDRQVEGAADGVIVTLGKGQSFGEMSLVDSGARSATVRATTETKVYEIDSHRFRELCETDTDLGYQVMRNIAIDLSFKLRSRNLI